MVKNIRARGKRSGSDITYGKKNYQLFFAGLAFIILGYVLMWNSEVYSQNALTVSILLLLVGYIVLLPLAIMHREKEQQTEEKS